MAANSLDVRAAPNIWDSDVRQMDTIMSALDDVVDRYDCKWSAKRSIKCVGPSIEMSMRLWHGTTLQSPAAINSLYQ